MHTPDTVAAHLAKLIAVSGGRTGSLIRQVCAQTLGLPPLPAEETVTAPRSDTEAVVAEFAEQFSVDVSAIDDDQRMRLSAALGDKVFGAVVQMYIADFLPRVCAGLAALGRDAPWAAEPAGWNQADPSDALFNGLLPAVGRLRALDPVTSEVVRLRGAAQHNCRLCKSLREGHALDAGGSETLYDDIAHFADSTRLTDRHKAALAYVDALIWSPAHLGADVVEGVRTHFSGDEAAELTFDVMRNAANKIAVALAADAPRVQHGTERYLIGADGQTVFG